MVAAKTPLRMPSIRPALMSLAWNFTPGYVLRACSPRLSYLHGPTVSLLRLTGHGPGATAHLTRQTVARHSAASGTIMASW